MPSDRDRLTYDESQQYRSVVAQQGRVLLPADFNEAQEIAGEQLRADALDIVGNAGTPDDGYKIDFPFPSAPPNFNFNMGPGTMYVGGERLTEPKPFTYLDQPDWLDPTAVSGTPSREYILLDIQEQEIGAIEDSALREVALGGPDTTARTRLMQRVTRQPVGPNTLTCADALAQQSKVWAADGLVFDPGKSMRLTSTAALKVGFVKDVPLPTLCEPAAQGGYLGAENQLIRVRVTAQNKFVWGFDNASFLYRAEIAPTGDNRTVKLQPSPVDSFHQPRVGQAVEILRAQAQLSDGEFVAYDTGRIDTLAEAYNPDTQSIRLPAALTPDFFVPAGTKRLFVRVWEQEVTFTPGTPTTLGSTGVQVTLQSGALPFHVGDFWVFAVRPSTPVKVYPSRYLDAFQPADGPRRWACPLYVIGWPDGRGIIVADCRRPFIPLIDLIDKGIRVTKVSVPGGADLVNDTDLKIDDLVHGIDITCDGALNPDTISRPTCYVTIEMPQARSLNSSASAGTETYQQLTLAAEVDASGAVVTWRPTAESESFLRRLAPLSKSERGYLMRLLLEGNYIWGATNPDLFLDGDSFGIRAAGATNTSLRLPSGDRRRGGRFLTWFWATPPPQVAIPVIRAEGLTELVGDVVFQPILTGAPTAAGVPVPRVNVTVFVNTNMTNAILPAESLLDVVLLIDEPTTLNASSATANGTGAPVLGVGGNGLDYTGGTAPNLFLGTHGVPPTKNSVTFLGVPIDPVPGRNRTIRIKNIRVNANQLGVSSTLVPTQVTAFVSITGSPQVSINNPTVIVAFIAPGETARALSADAKPLPLQFGATEILNPELANGKQTNAAVTQIFLDFSEGFANAFKARGTGAGMTDAVGRQESAFEPVVPTVQVGTAAQGTRFMAVFSNVPAGMQLFVTTRDIPAAGSVSPADPNTPPVDAVLISTDTSGAGGFSPVTALNSKGSNNVPIAQVSTFNGSGIAVWEWVSRSTAGPDTVQTVRFGLLVAAVAPALPGGAAPLPVTVRMSFAPLSTVVDSSSSAPVPRFVDSGRTINLFSRG